MGEIDDGELVLWQQLSWSHFREILPLKLPLQREYYAQMCCVERWTVRTLKERIDSICTGKKSEQIELLELDKAGIHVAEYLTALPSRDVLAKRLHLAALRAKQQIEQRETAMLPRKTAARKKKPQA